MLFNLRGGGKVPGNEQGSETTHANVIQVLPSPPGLHPNPADQSCYCLSILHMLRDVVRHFNPGWARKEHFLNLPHSPWFSLIFLNFSSISASIWASRWASPPPPPIREFEGPGYTTVRTLKSSTALLLGSKSPWKKSTKFASSLSNVSLYSMLTSQLCLQELANLYYTTDVQTMHVLIKMCCIVSNTETMQCRISNIYSMVHFGFH